MMHRTWSSIVEVPYCFSRSYIKFQGHTALKIIEFDPNWAFPDCNSSLNSPMAMKCCTKLETAKEGCPFVFQGHPSNFKVLPQIGHFRTIGRSQLSNPSDLPCLGFGDVKHECDLCLHFAVGCVVQLCTSHASVMVVFAVTSRSPGWKYDDYRVSKLLKLSNLFVKLVFFNVTLL